MSFFVCSGVNKQDLREAEGQGELLYDNGEVKWDEQSGPVAYDI